MTMKQRAALIGFGLIVLLGATAFAQEKLTLTTPVSQPSIADYTASYIGISRANWTITIQLTSNAGPMVQCTYTNPKGLTCNNGYVNATAPVTVFASVQAMIQALNKANLSTQSLENRIYARLLADGAFTGSVTGTPD